MQLRSIILFLLAIPLQGVSQIGHSTLVFLDASRNDRAVEIELYYPSEDQGDDVAVAEGDFPVIVFGHGFVMNYPAYENIRQALVPQGYIMAFPTTETGILPSHSDFGLDLSFIGVQLQQEGSNSESLLFGHVSESMAAMGHSMGGGCSFLAANNPGQVFRAVVGLAPAETNPSAIQAAAALDPQIPVLVLSGDADGVTPPNEHHLPIYNSAASGCKIFVNYVNGSHCYFANSGSLCDLGEFFPGSMSRDIQQEHTHEILRYWLDHTLKDSGSSLIELWNYIDSNDDLEILNLEECTLVGLGTELESQFSVYPNPFMNSLKIESKFPLVEVRLLSLNGQELYRQTTQNERVMELALPEELPHGVMMIELRYVSGRHYQMIVSSH